jgi:hypothetical protein
MESSEAGWHSFDPSVAVEDSEAMAQLLGVQYSGNEQKQPTTPTAMAMCWPGQEADDQHYSSAAAYPYCTQMQQPDPGASASCYDYDYYYGSNTFTITGDFFVPEEQVADPSFMLDLNLDFEYHQEGEGIGHGGGGNGDTAPVCKRKQLEDQKKGENTTCTVVPKKKSRSTAVPVSVLCHELS